MNNTETLLKAAEGLIAFAQKYTLSRTGTWGLDPEAARALAEWDRIRGNVGVPMTATQVREEAFCINSLDGRHKWVAAGGRFVQSHIVCKNCKRLRSNP